MARNFRTSSRRSLHRKVHATAAALALSAQPIEEADAYTWAVNAAIETGQTELAYEIAAGYQTEIANGYQH
ncbi:MAG: hypothetical protein QOF82_1279 [Frankiales bacterium]|jgi:hypothetical protein|nr:hypothetical protein [Frankiales bacterium]MDX6209698.1 hypothetical protein [Frankiales bacterium]MDX6212192.1 hypothetical protein [Frankiales bacterium]